MARVFRIINAAPLSIVLKMRDQIPPNFSWLEENVIAGLAFPDSKENLEFLVQNGIRYLITTSKEMQPRVGSIQALENINIGVEDYGTFDLEHIKTFIKVCIKAHEEKKGVAVHCRAGLGRTGTLLACYLVYFRGYSAEAATKRVRNSRPGSIETSDQFKTIENFYRYFQEKYQNS